jgi:hypothetical protein
LQERSADGLCSHRKFGYPKIRIELWHDAWTSEVCRQTSTAETSIARQRLARHVSAATNKRCYEINIRFRSKEWACNSSGTDGGGDLYSVLPEVIKVGHVRTPNQFSSSFQKL